MRKKLPKKIEKAFEVYKELDYKGCKIYLRRVGQEYFEYLALINNKLYSSFIILKAIDDKTKLTRGDINKVLTELLNIAVTTVDTILGVEEVPPKVN